MNWHLLPVSRDRYEASQREVQRLQRRVEKLEETLDARAMAVLQTSLRKNGYMQVGERDEQFEPQERTMQWSALDENVYRVWEDHYCSTTGATAEEARERYRQDYGNGLPSRMLS